MIATLLFSFSLKGEESPKLIDVVQIQVPDDYNLALDPDGFASVAYLQWLHDNANLGIGILETKVEIEQLKLFFKNEDNEGSL